MSDAAHDRPAHHGSWTTFSAMIATSTFIMFFLMYQLIYTPAHFHFSMSRALGSLVSGCVMTIVMLGFMWKMYGPARTKWMVMAAATIGGLGLFALNRTQALVDDTAFMKAMIPHHSIAINNSREADLSDPRVRKLADRIIEAQVKEIAQMEMLLDLIEANGEQGSNVPIRPASAALTPELLAEAKAAIERDSIPVGDDGADAVEYRP